MVLVECRTGGAGGSVRGGGVGWTGGGMGSGTSIVGGIGVDDVFLVGVAGEDGVDLWGDC